MGFSTKSLQPIHLPGYEFVRKIGTGGMGDIWLALDPEGQKRAIKIIKTKNELFYDALLQEAMFLIKLKHPNICRFKRLGDLDGIIFLELEHIEGMTLGELANLIFFHQQKLLPIDLLCHIFIQICKGLHYAHNRIKGLVHRDLSPHNIMLQKADGKVKILDFGIAKATNQLVYTESGVLKGKFAYMSPEQITGVDLDHRSDIFSLGIMLWELTTGRKLFNPPNGADVAVLNIIMNGEHERYPQASQFRSDIPYTFERIIQKSLAFDRKDRFQNCEEFQHAFETFLGSSPEVGRDLDAYLQEVRGESKAILNAPVYASHTPPNYVPLEASTSLPMTKDMPTPRISLTPTPKQKISTKAPPVRAQKAQEAQVFQEKQQPQEKQKAQKKQQQQKINPLLPKTNKDFPLFLLFVLFCLLLLGFSFYALFSEGTSSPSLTQNKIKTLPPLHSFSQKTKSRSTEKKDVDKLSLVLSQPQKPRLKMLLKLEEEPKQKPQAIVPKEKPIEKVEKKQTSQPKTPPSRLRKTQKTIVRKPKRKRKKNPCSSGKKQIQIRPRNRSYPSPSRVYISISGRRLRTSRKGKLCIPKRTRKLLLLPPTKTDYWNCSVRLKRNSRKITYFFSKDDAEDLCYRVRR